MELSKLMGCVKRPFIPSELFRDGLIDGAWFDPSDMTTMYQDAAGTIPVTAVEQPVGLILDKSRGLMLGPELVSNGDFSNGLTGWTAGVGISVVNGELVCATTSNEKAEQAGTYSFNKIYVVTLNISSYSSGGAFVTIGQGGAATIPSPQSIGKKTVYVKAGSVDSILRFYPGGFGYGGTLTIDNISVRELYGNHATQSVTASRPTLSARYNLLTKTEGLEDVGKTNVTTTPNSAISPRGDMTACLVTNTAIGGYFSQSDATASSTLRSCRVCVKNSSTGWVRFVIASLVTGVNAAGIFVNTLTGAKGDSVVGGTGYSLVYANSELKENGWVEIVVVVSGPAEVMRPVFSISSENGNNNAGSGASVLVWGFDQRIGDVRNFTYQRVNTATDYDTDQRYFPKYLRFDGVDDYLNLPYMGLYANGSASVVMSMDRSKTGIVKYALTEGNPAGGKNYIPLRLSDSGISSRIVNDNGTTVILTPESAGAPNSILEVITFIDDGVNLKLLKNSQIVNNSNYVRAGTLTLSNLTIGAISQAGVTENMLADMYGLIITKSALTDAQRVRCERFLAWKAGVML